MRQFMDHAQAAFYEATGWSHDGSYSALNATSDGLLAFPTPRGVRLTLSSLATPHFATSYQLGSVGVVDGSISYLFSSVPLAAHITAPSACVPLGHLSRAYRQLRELPPAVGKERQQQQKQQQKQQKQHGSVVASLSPPPPTTTTTATTATTTTTTTTTTKNAPTSTPPVELPSTTSLPQEESSALPRLPRPRSPMLLYGRLYLPASLLEALFVSRPSRSLQLRLSAVSCPTLKNGGTVLGVAQYDVGRFALEGLASSDGGLMGLRGAYNFGGDLDNPLGPSPPNRDSRQPQGESSVDPGSAQQQVERERIYGRFTAGGEFYYGTLNKSGGISVGARFATLPAHKGTPLTATLTINPLMGSIAATYAVVAGKRCSLATRFDFNVYSYDSNWSAGMELWRKGMGTQTGGEPEGTPKAPASDADAKVVVKKMIDAVGTPAVPQRPARSFQAKMEWRLDDPSEAEPGTPSVQEAPAEREQGEREEYSGVLKARLDQTLKLGILWEGRVQSLLYSVGSGIDLRKPDQPFRTLGLEIQFSS